MAVAAGFSTGVKAQVYEKVFSFTNASDALDTGATPYARLVQGSDGNFYGTTGGGGTNGAGTVFRMTPAGVLTTLVKFTGNGSTNTGGDPQAGLVQSSDGNFYGTTSGGGTSGAGTVFRITPGGVLTTLVNFTGNGSTNAGNYPAAGLVQGSDGNFYGTTYYGGTNGDGTVFKMTPGGILTTLVNFSGDGSANEGAGPYAGLVTGTDGNFYGTTFGGGTNSDGTVFKMTPAGVLTTLVNFTFNGSADAGAGPYAGLLLGSDGNFYGTTFDGGTKGNGTVFKMTPAGVLTTLVNYTGNGSSNSGDYPEAGLVQGSDGNFYGTTLLGGTNGDGTVFKMTPGGVLTTLVNFTSANAGTNPSAGLVQGSDGNFYGTTQYGGANSYGYGTVFQMTSAGVLTTLVSFTGKGSTNAGAAPYAGLVTGTDGNFYGTTQYGGANSDGTVFQMTPTGVLTTLVNFTANGSTDAGEYPYAGLVTGTDGNFYGTTSGGGTNSDGTVFKVTPAGVLTTLVNFTGNGSTNTGEGPQADLVQTSDGNFYGTTSGGGTNGDGTVFRMTPGGVLTTLVNFTGNGSTNAGDYPVAGLVTGTDGNFYGTTTSGGTYGLGTVFQMTPAGALTTLVNFTGDGSTNAGADPAAGLVTGTDGNFYGTTYSGGASNGGTVFQMTPAGVLTTIYDFSNDSFDNHPQAPLIAGSDGNLYGTTSGDLTSAGDGSVYCLIFPGVPTVYPLPPEVLNTTAVVSAQVNARGSVTNVSLEYGTDDGTFQDTVPLSDPLNGYQTTLVGNTLIGLTPGATYYYEIVATSASGTTISPVQSFTTSTPPTAAVTAATGIGPNSATLNGVVNAGNFSTGVQFEYGTDGNTFPNQVPAIPAIVTGTANTSVSASIAGLTAGVTYYVRITATNAGGATVTGDIPFTPPVTSSESLTAAIPLSTISALVSGSVSANNSITQVAFYSGTDGVNFTSVPATPATVTGTGYVPVSATLNNLSQGSTYYYYIQGSNAGGVSTSGTGSFTLDFLSGFAQVYPGAPENANGYLLVNLAPASLAGEGWRFVGEQQWRPPGVPLGGIASGNFYIEFRPVPGYLQPPQEPVQITSGSAATIVSAEYYQTPVPTDDGINVTLLPASVTTGTDPAQWEFVGDNGTNWRNSGITATGLSAGVYLVEFKPVPGETTPATEAIGVPGPNGAAIVSATAAYFLSGTPVGSTPAPLPYSSIVSGTGLPYAFVGQIRSDDGEATGFVVLDRVVATAGHVVFDDATLNWTTGLQWLFQREAGTYEPVPLTPTGSYVLSGYAAQRILENTPGVSSPQSQDLDAAAMYFTQEAAPSASGTGAYGGYLASDSEANEFLLSSALMTLVGYPVDGIPTAVQGQMFATPPANIPFNLEEPAEIDGTTGVPYRLYTTTGITAAGGMSGSPLCVQFQGGTYYPAAIYLGGNGDTVVRAIDSDVVNLFTAAESSGYGGANHSGGGIIQVDAPGSAATFTTGGINVTLGPSTAVAAGAGWSLDGGSSYQASGATLSTLTPGTYVVTFAPVPGYSTPGAQNVPVESGEIATFQAGYTRVPPPTITSGSQTTAIEGQPFNYQITSTPAATSYSASTFPSGLTLNGATGLISGTAPQVADAAGIFPLSLQATDSTGPGNPFILSLRVAAPGQLTVTISGQGAVSKGFLGATIQPVGPPALSIKATPARGYLFGYWSDTDTGDILTTAPEYTFTMPSFDDIQANFVIDPFLTAAGSYLALLQGPSYTDSGFAKFTVTPTGSFTATFNLGGIPTSTHGVFNNLGQFQNPSTTLSLTAGALLTGTLTDQSNNTQIPFTAERTAPHNDASLKGSYTALLPAVSGTGLPGGNGYGSLTVSKTGIVKFTGKLGDALPVTFSGNLNSTGALPFLISKPATKTVGAELLLGNVAFPPAATGTAGALTWYRTPDSIYPAGFSLTLPILTSRYTPPPINYSPATVTFSGADLSTPLIEPITIKSGDQVTTTGLTPFTLKFAPATGQFTGTFPYSGKPRPFTGAVLQSGTTVLGLFQDPSTAQTGSVQIQPTQ